MNVNVLHLSFSDARGGAARSAYKIHDGLRRLGLTSRMLVRHKDTGDPDVDTLGKGWRRGLDALGSHLLDPVGLQALLVPSSLALLRHPWYRQADIVQLYTVHGGYLSLLALPWLGRGKRLVWRLSDLWPATGRCAYPYDCSAWTTGCGCCVKPHNYPGSLLDLSAWMWRLKRRLYRRTDITLVGTNAWMARQAAASPLLARFPLATIPNGVDTDLLRPLDKAAARAALGLPQNMRVALFAAQVAAPGTRKGGAHAIAAMERLAASGRDDLVLAVLGEGSEAWPEGRGYRSIRLGSARGDRFLAAVYSSADLLIYPAVAENFPNTVIEAMACGVPAAAFDSGGLSDIVRPGDTGILVPTRDVDRLAREAGQLLDDPARLGEMSRRCRETVEAGYALGRQAEAFAGLYASLVENNADNRRRAPGAFSPASR